MAEIQYPFGDADVRTITTATTLNVNVTDQMTYLKLSANLTGATTVNLIAGTGVRNGAQLFIEVPCGGTAYDVAFGSTYATSAGLTGTINKTKVAGFVFANGKFVHVSTNQIN